MDAYGLVSIWAQVNIWAQWAKLAYRFYVPPGIKETLNPWHKKKTAETQIRFNQICIRNRRSSSNSNNKLMLIS